MYPSCHLATLWLKVFHISSKFIDCRPTVYKLLQIFPDQILTFKGSKFLKKDYQVLLTHKIILSGHHTQNFWI